jgi:hypothetical protein
MPFPIKVCAICSEEFELRPDKPGFANRCPECSAADEEAKASADGAGANAFDPKSQAEVNEARRNAMRDMLYRKDS